MSKYTTEVRFICESLANVPESEGYKDIAGIVEKARPKIFDFDYPIFDDNYKRILETKILRHYYTREIGCETVGLWKQMLATRMNEIMPYYNKLYESELLAFNPFYNIDYTRDFQKQNDNTESGLSTTTNDGTASVERHLTGGDETHTDNVTTKDGSSTKTGEDTTRTEGELHEGGNIVDELDINKHTNNTDTGSDTRTITDEPTVTTYELFSDTPQGDLDGVNSENYLTTAKKTTVDGTGSEKVDTIVYGKINDVSETGGTTNNRIMDTTNSATGKDTTEYNSTVNTDETVNQNGNVVGEKQEDETSSTTNHGSSDVEHNKTFNGLEDYLEHMKGKNSAASFSKLLMEFRETFLNIDMLVIEKLSDLFFLLW